MFIVLAGTQECPTWFNFYRHEERGAPGWALELAGKLKCPECEEAAKPRPQPPASTGEDPKIYEILGTDVFEYEDEEKQVKHKLILWRDRGSSLTMIDHLMEYTGAWEPRTENIIQSLSKWLMTYPQPKWILADAARYYSSSEMMNFLNRSGIGLTIAPAEAHWIMGHEESAINLAKRTLIVFAEKAQSCKFLSSSRWRQQQ